MISRKRPPVKRDQIKKQAKPRFKFFPDQRIGNTNINNEKLRRLQKLYQKRKEAAKKAAISKKALPKNPTKLLKRGFKGTSFSENLYALDKTDPSFPLPLVRSRTEEEQQEKKDRRPKTWKATIELTNPAEIIRKPRTRRGGKKRRRKTRKRKRPKTRRGKKNKRKRKRKTYKK